jgi:hypothetical protein
VSEREQPSESSIEAPADATPEGRATGPSGADEPPAARPYDPERGLRGAMSATLLLEGITVLLAIPVARNTGNGISAWGVVAIVLLAVALIAACAFVRRPWAVSMIVGLQALTVCGWFLSAPLGMIGVIFGLVWVVIFYLRAEFRRRAAAGTLPRAG